MLRYFEAGTEAFSPFAVSGLKGVVVPAAWEAAVTAAPEATVTVQIFNIIQYQIERDDTEKASGKRTKSS